LSDSFISLHGDQTIEYSRYLNYDKEFMKQQKSGYFWLKACISANPTLEDAIIDYLLGVMGASIEQSVDTGGNDICLNVYLKEQSPDSATRHVLQEKIQRHLVELAAIFQVDVPQITWEQIEDQDWSSNWKIHFKPFSIIENLVIAPTWEEYMATADEKVIVMDPGMAFGTGHHATTSLSLNFLRQRMSGKTGQRVLDVGTGTGILAMGAALFGSARVLGIDNDPEAVRAAGKNLLLNRLENVVEVSLEPLQGIQEEFDIIVANIIHDILAEMRSNFWELLAAGGELVVSGILHGEQEENVIRLYTDCGFTLAGQERQDEWIALCFTKQSC